MKTINISIPKNKRIICISDIHGELDLFKRLLEKVRFCDDDYLVLLGDLYTKGAQCHETLKHCISLSANPNVYALRGNCDWVSDYLSAEEARWLEELPDIINTGGYVFVHTGLSQDYFSNPEAETYIKYNNFLETASPFEKWVVVGHWPVSMYCHEIPCHNPIVSKEKKVIAIDGGNVIKSDGQLNAFIIDDSGFSFECVDDLPEYVIKSRQESTGGTLSASWMDRFIEMIEDGDKLCRVKHLATGRELVIPKSQIWTNEDGKLCGCNMATDYYLQCSAGDVVSLVEAFEDRVFVKKDGVSGWVKV